MMEEDGEEEEEEEERGRLDRLGEQLSWLLSKGRHLIGHFVDTGGQILVTTLLGLTGIMLPSLSSGVYLLCFQTLCTVWSVLGGLPPLLFSCVCVCSSVFSAGHLLLVYCYQLQSVQEAVPPEDTYASVFGMVSLVSVDCAAPWWLRVNSALSWYHYTNPLLLLLLYYTVASICRVKVTNGDEEESKDPTPPIRTDDKVDREPSDPSQPPAHLPAERRREMWRSAHYNADLELDLFTSPHYSLSQSDTCIQEDDVIGWELEQEVSPASTAFNFLLKQSYICALIAMMAWSITYVSWFTCVLLLWSCALWMLRERRRYTMMSSAWLVAYGNLLLILQYISCFAAVDAVPGLFLKKDVPCVELASKIICLLTFWLLLRQALTEKANAQKEAQLADVSIRTTDEASRAHEGDRECGTHQADILFLNRAQGAGQMESLVAVVSRMFVKYWIYVCGTMFFFVSFEGTIVVYKVIYMVLFLCCVALYQLNYECWRAWLRWFWVAVVGYSMLVLILIYTFQFPSSVTTWTYYTGLSTLRLEDIGLEKFSVPVLFTRIFIPTAFLLVCVLHLHYFHQPFLQLTDLKTVVNTHNSTITRLVHSDGSLEDLAFVPSLPFSLEDDRKWPDDDRKWQEDDRKWPEDDRKWQDEQWRDGDTWLEEEEDKREYPCVWGRETPSEQIRGFRSHWRLVVERLTELFLRLLLSLQKMQHLLWWLLELHIIKIVSAYILWVSVKEVCLFNLVFVVSWAVALPCRVWRPLASSVCTVWTCVIAVSKMLYQLNAIQPFTYSSNCTVSSNVTADLSSSLLYAAPVDPAQWVGLRKTDGKLLDYLRYNMVMLALLAFEVTIYRHQELYRLRSNVPPHPTRTLFHDITRQHLDDGLLNCMKYFANYFFYKFGLETCFLLAVNVIGQRMDLFAVGHALGLITILSRRSRKQIALIWKKYCYYLSGLLCFQYLLCIGFPPAACKEYPWRSSDTDSNVVKWLYLPDYLTPPDALFILYDFLLLLGASIQLLVFEEEAQTTYQVLAGDNREQDQQASDPISLLRYSHAPNFIFCRSYLDMMKVIMFSYLFWFVLTIIFITGTTRISIFCMGYLVACFYFLLVGGDLLLKPIRIILVYWDCLIGYNIFVITMKNILSILACGYIKSLVLNHCWLIQLFSLACTIKGYTKPEQQSSKQCELPSDEAGIIWDSICFCCLLLQRRVFTSQYFLHVVLDLRNTQLLASRGAELIEAATVKAVRERLELEKGSMDLLKRQMERIKSRQQKFRRGKQRLLSNTEGQTDRKGRNQKEWWRPWVDHASMVRSGNYYLFETDSEEEEERPEEPIPDRSAFQFVYHAWVTDTRTALRARNKRKKALHLSPPLSPPLSPTEDGQDGRTEDEEEEEDVPDNVLRRVANLLRFWWVLLSAVLDSLNSWLRTLCQEHLNISTVLRIEHCMLTQQANQGTRPSRETIHVFYQQQMLRRSMESGLQAEGQDYVSHESQGRDFVSHASQGQDCASQESDDVFVTNVSPKKASEHNRTLADIELETDSRNASCNKPEMAASQHRTLESEGLKVGSQQTPGTETVPGEDTDTEAEEELPFEPEVQRASSVGTQTRQPAAKASRCARPKLSRMGRIPSLSSSSSLEGSRTMGSTEALDPHPSLGTHPLSTPKSPSLHTCTQPSPSSPPAASPVLPPTYSQALGLRSRQHKPGCRAALQAQGPPLAEGYQERPTTSSPPQPRPQELTANDLLRHRMFYNEELGASDRFYGNQPQLLQLCYALYNILVARSEMVCYLVMVLNHMVSASCLTLTLPVCVFLWAMLSVPRPSKRFWMTAIIYTEAAIVIKYFFQFGFFPFNQKMELDRSKPFHPPNILGVEKKDGYVLYDLLQLLALFFHRSILKCHGLWDQNPVQQEPRAGPSPSSEDPPAPPQDLKTGPSIPGSPEGSVCSQPTKSDLLLEKLKEAFIRSKNYSVNRGVLLYGPIRDFFKALVQPEYSAVSDVYVAMFLADTIDFIIIVFGFWAFGKHSAAADITSSLSEDQVPEAFLVMVLIQFGTMVIDRALYLRKTVVGKLIFQVLLVFGIHFWMFFILPSVTDRRFNHNSVAQLWYFVKCVYFGLSAYQIRSGYPTRVLGNFLTKSHNYLNLFLFQGFRMVPFLTELRAVMDWVWTDTTLSLSSWICVEDIYAHTFVLKCWRESERRYPQPRGQKKKRVVKYGMGGLIVLLLICIVWFPLLFMSLVKSVAGVVNKPLDVSLTITLGGYQPIFTMSAQQNQLKDLNEEDYHAFISLYSYTPNALQFFEAYTKEDVTVAELEGSSNSLWTISPPSRQYLSQVLGQDEDFPLTISWTIQRNLSLGAKAELASGKHVTYLDDDTRLNLIHLLSGNTSTPVVIGQVFPCFMRAPSDSNAKPIEQLYTEDSYKDIQIALERSTSRSGELQEWWIVDQPAHSLTPTRNPAPVIGRRRAGLELFVFSDKVSPPSLGFLAGYGIMGLYASVVLVIGKFVREFFSGISHSLMFEELPCVDRILKLCTDIFLVRETGELELEEELYAKLIFLYRSPETLIKWTRRTY
ncbi:piezo-type mechanosensitive ion channel component 2-like isoform X1 [Gadus macrocephalus]|uniref:piezo-type mechanosensitive ion channel component 2-like isoform X1 n=1 Tax=Gadus macrocephalus TaxID=80720 RepID=UPI0028CB635A|nr:piezo-type mechanosensitive ion channel component 2-like isoform X1 [Gadus macrocephalus]